MEFLKVSENKLKIMLDKSEMKKYKLEDAELDCTSSTLRGGIWEILDRAKSECGFYARGEKLLVQFYPSKSGGEIFVTKLGALSRAAEKSISSSPRVAVLDSGTKIYKFESLDVLSSAVHAALSSLPGDMRAYSGEGGEYFIAFEDRSECSPLILEFARSVPAVLESYIREHSIPISRPLETLDKLYRLSREQ